MTNGFVQDRNLEKQIGKQIGCMTGFFQIFDRHQVLTGKRLYATKRLPSAPAVQSSPESDKAMSTDFVKHQQEKLPSPENPSRISTPLSDDSTKSPWKFSRVAPRLSLDSRAVIDAKGGLKHRDIPPNAAFLSATDNQRRSTSVIARLMGLEPSLDPQPPNVAELRRSSSESRVARDQYRFIDGINFQLQQNHSNGNIATNVVRDNNKPNRPDYRSSQGRAVDPPLRTARAEPAKPMTAQRKSFFDSADIFPEPKQNVCIYGEIEKRLRMEGIEEPSKDLDTLKQILEALQLKGLLHYNKPRSQYNNRNIVYETSSRQNESPILVMRHVNRIRNVSPPINVRPKSGGRLYNNPVERPRRERSEIERYSVKSQIRERSPISPRRSEKSPNRKSVETQKRVSSPVKVSSSRSGPNQTLNRSPRNRKHSDRDAEDELSTVSGSSVSASSQTDMERPRVETFKEGRSLLERCDKLLHSIAEMTSTELQTSPVSVLDSSFYKQESSPSPVMKRSIEFKVEEAIESEDDDMRIESISEDDCDFLYISDIIRASSFLQQDTTDIFMFVEKQQYVKGKDTSKVSKLERKLIFDTIYEILNRKRQLPPWKAAKESVSHVWSEFQKIRERDACDEDMFEVICGMLKKDLAVGDGMNGWEDSHIQMSDPVLDIERLIFKDLVGETIWESCKNALPLLRRKLVF